MPDLALDPVQTIQSATLTAGPMPEASEFGLGPVGLLNLLARWASGLKQ